MLFVCIGSASAVENQTDDISENEVIGVSESPDGGTFNDLQVKIDTASEGTVNLANNYTYDESFSQEGIKITKAITINGNGFTINGLDKARIFNINASENIVLNNITFINGKSDLGGAIIFNTAVSDIVIDNCKFINNSAATNGGAIYAKSTFINSTIKNTEFISNTATKNGGAVYINENASENTFENITFSYNKAKSADGGAINFHNPLSKTTFKNITFFKNSAGNGGGAINTDQNVNDDNSYINVKFINNTAPNGGAINGYGSSNYNSFDGCVFANNTATSHGGAIYYKATFNYNSFEYCSFINNTAEKNGGVIYLYRASNFNKFNENSFINNTATNNAGVVYYRGSSSSDIYNNTEFINNTALSVDGGCISVYSNLVNITFDNSTFINNKAGGNGGAINVDNAARTNNFINTKFINNTASKNGGAISLVDAADNIWNNTIFTQNKANISGGAIHAFKKMENYNIINSSFIENTAKTNGGAINIPYNSTNSNIADSSFINNTAGIGGAIYYIYSSNDTFFNVNFTNNKATSLNNSHGGGAIYVNGSAINDRFDSLIFNNNTARYGGALYIGQLLRNRFVNIEFINNTAGFNGGAVYIEKAFKHNKFNNTTFKNNKALRNGGAIYTVPSSLVNTFENSTFENNNASEVDGGAINLHTDLLETVFNNVKFISNTAGFNGGAINIDHGSKDNLFNNTSFIDNAATRNGGAIYARYHSITNTYKNTLFKNNTAINVDGGAINSYGNLLNNTFDNSTFINNTGRNGGAINVDTNAKNNVFINTEFKENTARSNGGAFCVDNTDNNTWNNTRFTGNNANNTGGAIHTNELMQNEKIINSTFTDNFAGINGSALDIKGENINISDSKFINNSANVIVAQVSGLSILNSGFTNNKGYSIDLNNSEALIENSIFNNDAGASIRVLDDSVLYLSKNELSPQEYILDKGIILSETKIVVLNNLTINCNVGEEITLNATIYDDNGNTIIVDDLDFIIESETIDSTLENTTYKSDYTPKLGRHIVSASVDSNLNKYTVDYGLIIAKYNSCVEITQLNNITYGEKLNMEFEFENSTSVLIEVTDENGNVIYNNTTSSNSIILENLSAGIYSITITTQESENYTASSTNATVTVSKMATEITLANETIELKAYKSIGDLATLNPADAGNLTYTSSDEDVVLVSEDGIIFARIKGTATVTVSFAGDDNYKAAESKNITVSVTLNDASVSVENDTIDLNVDDTCIINATSNPSFLTVYYTSSNESVATVTDYGNVKAIGEGTAVITLTVGNGETYAVNSTNVTVTVSKIATAITVDPDSLDLSVGDETVIVAALTPANAGNVTFTSSDESVVTVDNQGNIIAEGKGQAIITVSFAGDNKYAAAKNKTITVNVSLNDARVTVDNDTLDLKVDETYAIKATKYPDTILLDITYKSSDNSVATVDKNGIVTAISEGSAIITLEVGDDVIYAKNSTTVTVTVKKIPTDISIANATVNLNVDDEVSTGATLNPEEAGNLTFTSSDESVAVVKGGKIIALKEGDAIITVSFKGNNKYAEAKNKTIKVIVKKLNPNMDITAEDITEGENATINVELPIDATGNVTTTVNGKTYSSPVDNGKSIITIPDLEYGNYTLPVTYSGDDKYNSLTNDVNLTVKEDEIIVSAPDLTKYYSGNERFTVNVAYANGRAIAGKEVKVTINGVTYKRTTDENGSASLSINLNSGVYPVRVVVDGVEANYTVTVMSTIDSSDIVKIFRNGTQYNAIFTDANGTPLPNIKVSFNLHGIIYNRTTDKNGAAKLNINLDAGDYIITAFNSATGEMKSNTIKVISLIESDDLTKYYRNSSQFVVRIHSADGGYVGAGEEVSFNINGVIYTRLTNATGHAKLNINLGQGNYTITTYYKDCGKGNNIEVLPILTAEDLSMKYMDGSQFKAKLVDGQGNPYPNQSVTFNVNGVFYNRATDSDGIVKLNIRLMAGEYIITSTYNGCNIANKITIRG